MEESLLNGFLFIFGLSLLIFSSHWLIQSSLKVSILFKLTPLFIGLILIAIGTSAPEAGVGIIAAIRNQKDIALGNIIGSNIANIGLVLGLCALIDPLRVKKSVVKSELPLMLFSVVLLYVLSLDLLISRMDGALFILFFIIFCFISYKGARKSFDFDEVKDLKLKKWLENITSPVLIFVIILLSLFGVVLGADLMVRAGVSLAKNFGISAWFIAITVFAIGTSLPELAVSLVATIKKAHSISVGNIIGSNIFNILFVLGIASIIRPISLSPQILKFEFPALFLFSILLFTAMKTEYKITRREGLVLFGGYFLFLILLIIRSR